MAAMGSRTTSGSAGRARPSGGSIGQEPPAVAVAPPARRLRLPELAVGLFVTVAFALAAVLWHLNAVTKVPALATRTAVGRGDKIRATDLRLIYVSSDDPFAHLGAGDTGRVVGRVALVDIRPGTLVAPSLIGTANGPGSGEGIVGLALDPGQYPAVGLAMGDHVDVVRSLDQAPDRVGSAVLARHATVFAVDDLGSDRKFVSIRTSESHAEAIASASGRGALRLVLVSR